MAYLEVSGLEKSYVARGRTAHVLGGVDLTVDEGEFVAVVGYSGSGKTTLVSLIAGLLSPDRGEIVLDGARVTEPGPERGIVFSILAAPRLTVQTTWPRRDAVNARASAVERRRLTDELIALSPHAGARQAPARAVGGMRQRSRWRAAWAWRPSPLMDEPFSALDALTRATLQDELTRIWGERRCTVILITNDVDEAILLADRIYPMTPGPGAVLGAPIEVGLPRPRSRRHMSLTPPYQKARQALVDFLRSRRGAA